MAMSGGKRYIHRQVRALTRREAQGQPAPGDQVFYYDFREANPFAGGARIEPRALFAGIDPLGADG